ncbi:MAG: fused MFS/spermidine synthase [Anaerolineae bacterium]|nr:fused MFS/spermidine synthase [Anaerolineae bacterium]
MPYSYYYAFSVLLSAFLLFQVQPMVGKYILPWFGGTPTVWSAVLLFFQAVLSAGYGYAYWLLGRRRRLQGLVHVGLLGLSAGLLVVAALSWRSPLTPNESWRPQGGGLSVWEVFRVLAVSVGVPYFLLSANSTLMQAWFVREEGRSPYRLYALSNLGSLAGLLSYPLLFEPRLTLRTQGYLWSAAYGVFAVCAGYLALRARRQVPLADQEESIAAAVKRPGFRRYLLWGALAASASALLVSVSNQITQEVAPVPFLWVLPLAIYLLSFILAFSGGRWYARRLYLSGLVALSAAAVWMLVRWPPFGVVTQVVLYALLLFVCCMICHSELYRLRPDPRFLPSFYLMTAAGGAVGGIFVTLVAPYLFTSGFWELQAALIVCWVLLGVVLRMEPASPPPSKRRLRREVPPQMRSLRPAVLLCGAVAALLTGFMVLYVQALETSTLLARRNFYGVLRVWERDPAWPDMHVYQLAHGKTIHGFQFVAEDRRSLPTTYYGPTSGVGLAIANHPARAGGLRVGALGLGVGVIATYGQPGDLYRFYEINPDVIRIAEGEGGYFSFLRDSKAEVQVVPGDARISLERELATEGPQGFDLLVLDAFSGDAVPVHLLTKEAFALYLQHLKPGGIIAVNISNRYFDLSLPLYRLADELNLGTAVIVDRGDGIRSYDSVWMLLAPDRSVLEVPAIAERSARRELPHRLPLWTDDFGNLLQVLR